MMIASMMPIRMAMDDHEMSCCLSCPIIRWIWFFSKKTTCSLMSEMRLPDCLMSATSASRSALFRLLNRRLIRSP